VKNVSPPPPSQRNLLQSFFFFNFHIIRSVRYDIFKLWQHQ